MSYLFQFSDVTVDVDEIDEKQVWPVIPVFLLIFSKLRFIAYLMWINIDYFGEGVHKNNTLGTWTYN